MFEDFYKKLSLAVYRVTELFPEREPLKFQIRELANEILKCLLLGQDKEKCSFFLKVLENYFDLAEAQNWVDSRNFLVLRREYDKIKKTLGNRLISWEKTGKMVQRKSKKREVSQQRKGKILEVLREKKKIHLKEITQIFPEVSKRTLIRDLEELYQQGEIIRIGNGRSSCYYSKDSEIVKPREIGEGGES